MPQHIALVLPDLGGGGAERLTIDLARGFAERGAKVDLVLLQQRGPFLDMVPPGVNVVDLAAPRLRSAIVPLRRYFKDQRPDAVLAAMWPLTSVAILAFARLSQRPRMVVCDHCPLLEQYATSAVTKFALRLSIRATYRHADAIVAVSAGLADELARLAGLDSSRVTTIYNPIPPPLRSDVAADWGPAPGQRILAVGSLKTAKNFPLLLKAFAPLARAGEAVLAIVGTGTERDRIVAQAVALGLGDRFILPGFCATPGDWYATTDLFVLPSDYEGFGNVLVEAMHCGKPIVSTDCRYGPAEVLGNGQWGTLVPPGDVAAMTSALRAALATPADSAALAMRAGEFSVERAVDAYWRVLGGS